MLFLLCTAVCGRERAQIFFSLVAVNGFITEESLTTLMIGFYEKMTGETIEQQDVEEDVEGMGGIIFFRFYSF